MSAPAHSVHVHVPDFVYTEDAAEYLGLSPRTLEKWRSIGEGPEYSRLGRRRVVYHLGDLDSWVRSRRVGGASA